jgi:hypothetical protein
MIVANMSTTSAAYCVIFNFMADKYIFIKKDRVLNDLFKFVLKVAKNK